MSDDYIEKDLDDEVYEDEYYEEHYEDEELKDSEDGFYDDDEDEAIERKVNISYACEDCDYRWEDVIFKKYGDELNDYEVGAVCPMCGSVNVTQI